MPREGPARNICIITILSYVGNEKPLRADKRSKPYPCWLLGLPRSVPGAKG